MEIKTGDKIYFKCNPQLNARHTYEILKVESSPEGKLIKIKNIVSKQVFTYKADVMIKFGCTLREEPVKPEVKAVNTCTHPETQDQIFSTFKFRQCKICKADLGDI